MNKSKLSVCSEKGDFSQILGRKFIIILQFYEFENTFIKDLENSKTLEPSKKKAPEIFRGF